MSLALVTAPTEEPITLADAKLAGRIETVEEDALIASYLATARQSIDGRDGWLGRAIMPQTWDLLLDRFPVCGDPYYVEWPGGSGFSVPLPPLQSITSIGYTDINGSPQTVNSSLYTVDTQTEPGRVLLKAGNSWPATDLVPNAVAVRFVAGYANAAAVPDRLKTFIRQATSHFYLHREARDLPNQFFWSIKDYWIPCS